MGPLPKPCITNEKSASPEWYANTSRSSAIERTSGFSVALWRRNPAQPRSCTSRLQMASASSPWACARFCAAQASASRASVRCFSSKNGQSRCAKRSTSASVAFEHRLLLRRKRLVGAVEVFRLHEDRLGLRFHFDRLVDADVPFLVQHLLGHGVRQRRAGRQLFGNLQGLIKRPLADAVEEAPRLPLLGAHRAAGVEQLRRAALADDARQDGAGAHVAARQPDSHEQKRGLRGGRRVAQVAGHGNDGAGTGTNAFDGGDHRLRAMAHRLHQITGHARELEQLRHRHLRQQPDDLVHIAARAEVASGAGYHNAFYFLWGLTKKIAQFSVRLECQRILLLRPVERDDAHLAFGAPLEMLGLPHDRTPTVCCLTFARSFRSSSCSRRERPARSSTTQPSCARAISANARSPARVRRMRKARRSAGSSSRSTRPSFSSWSTIAVTLPPVTISMRESSFIFNPSRCRSSCDIRSKRGSVLENCSRSRERTWRSMSWVQVSRRSQMRSAWWSSERAMDSRSMLWSAAAMLFLQT